MADKPDDQKRAPSTLKFVVKALGVFDPELVRHPVQPVVYSLLPERVLVVDLGKGQIRMADPRNPMREVVVARLIEE